MKNFTRLYHNVSNNIVKTYVHNLFPEAVKPNADSPADPLPHQL